MQKSESFFENDTNKIPWDFETSSQKNTHSVI